MDKLYWVIPGKLAGRPGPDRAPWSVEALLQIGIRAVLSVNDGLLVHPEDFDAHGVAYACVPLSDNAPPVKGDDRHCEEALPIAYHFAATEISRGNPVLVHCSSGKDRTGLFLCYFLMRQFGLSPAEAIRNVRRVQPIVLSASGWEDFAIDLLSSCSQEHITSR
jgi:protein-tyrosine phosphatase